MEPIVLSLFLIFFGIVILYFVVKEAVKAGIKEAWSELKAPAEAETLKEPEQKPETAEQQEQKTSDRE